MDVNIETFFRALGDFTRLRCVMLLQQEHELCVCELTYALDTAQPKISRHLASLREIGVVQVRREGLRIYYRLHPRLPSWAQQVLLITAQGVADEDLFAADRQKLAMMPNRPDSPQRIVNKLSCATP